MRLEPKVKVRVTSDWDHHHHGWGYVVDLLQRNADCATGVLMVTSIEDVACEGQSLEEPWVGFVHQVPKNGLEWFPDLDRLLSCAFWSLSKRHCLGLFTLSSYVKDFLVANGAGVPVARLFYPSPKEVKPFDPACLSEELRLVLGVGEFLRRHESLYALNAPGYRKVLLNSSGAEISLNGHKGSVEVLGRLPGEEYDALLAKSVVFLDLIDAPANTTVVECVRRQTPLVVNRLPGVEEYLGSEYPLYYDSLGMAEDKLQDRHLLREAHEYLKQSELQDRLDDEFFLKCLGESAIYRSLPSPGSSAGSGEGNQASSIPALAVMLFNYKRVDQLGEVIRRLCDQTFRLPFEIILWNNNYDSRDEVDAIVAGLNLSHQITVIHSTKNQYCAPRMAVAALTKAPVILFVDDDVLVEPEYFEALFEKHHAYGGETVICCRGHVFDPHEVCEENPGSFWTDYEHMRFLDETDEDQPIHFLHADNCIMSRSVLLQVANFDLLESNKVLVDDYWISYILQAKLGIPIWKVKADHLLAMSPSAEDAAVAMFHNPAVTEERISFYVEHMRAGWPYPKRSPTLATAENPHAVFPWRGFNASLVMTDSDMEKAAAAGIRCLRLGACESGADLAAIGFGDPRRVEEACEKLRERLSRLEDHGLDAVVTFTDLPGRNFLAQETRLFEDGEAQAQAISMWRSIARNLAEVPNLAALDLVNEPFLEADLTLEYDIETPRANRILMPFYERAVAAIREVNSAIAIIIEPTFWASPMKMEDLEAIADERVYYSFHMYMPRTFTRRASNQGLVRYPGYVPSRPGSRYSESELWDKTSIKRILGYIRDWQLAQNIPSERVIVGEVGVTREADGASEYLCDMLDSFGEFGWGWFVYAFRERKWDSMDYELGPHLPNMFRREPNPLFSSIIDRIR